VFTVAPILFGLDKFANLLVDCPREGLDITAATSPQPQALPDPSPKDQQMSIIEPTGSLPERPAPGHHRSLRVVLPREGVDLPAAERA
jgi:hypothetical protein